MKYKVGDKVRVRSDLIPNTMYGEICFGSDINSIIGEIVTIDRVNEKYYKIKNLKCYVSDEMLEPITDYLTTEELAKEVKTLGLIVDELEYTLYVELDSGDNVATVAKRDMFEISTDNINHDAISDDTRTRLYNLLDRYARTPLDKRVAEKRFMLKYPTYRLFECFMGKGNTWDSVGENYTGDGKAIFTEADIPEIQEKFPEMNFDKLERIPVE